jgi:hypothetical protein
MWASNGLLIFLGTKHHNKHQNHLKYEAARHPPNRDKCSAWMGELLSDRHRQQGVPGDRQLHSCAVPPEVALQAQGKATQGRDLSTLAPLVVPLYGGSPRSGFLERWLRFFEQNFRVDKWSSCGVGRQRGSACKPTPRCTRYAATQRDSEA